MIQSDWNIGGYAGSFDYPPVSLDSGSVASDSGIGAGILLEVRDVTKVFDKNILALDKVSFQMERGGFLFVVGPNQAGKTTLVRLIAAEERPTEGEIYFDGFQSRQIKKKHIPLLRRKMGRVFEDFKLINEMSVFDNVALSLRISGAKEKRIKDKVFQALGRVGLSGKSKLFPAGLSSAEKRKVGIARATVGDRLLLLADEPTSNLDEEGTAEILELLTRVNLLGTAVLLATSDFRLCDGRGGKIIRMEKGKVI